jgi:ABC-type polysaccharide/polyol phosphate transport system ATPase subunit
VEELGGGAVTVAVEATGVSLAYRLTRDRAGTMKEFAINTLKRKTQREEFWAVRDVSFSLSPGEVLGVVGPNGAGKSTLMKMVARVLPPTEGRMVVRGVVAPMIELGAGFNQEMSAYDNIVLYGTLLGRTPSQMRERVQAISEWAELTDFIDVPVRSYSSGMMARLGFAVATDISPDVLVVDEVLSVGDTAFQEKSKARIADLIDTGAAVLFVSHQLATVKEMSDRVIWLDHGRMVMTGDPDEVVDAYANPA